MSEKEKMLAGDFYNARDKKLLEDYMSCRKTLDYFNDNRFDNQYEVLTELLGSVEKGVWIEKPFFCDYGKNISIGKDTFINFNCTFLDCGKITIGKNVLIGPGTHIYAVTHPVNPAERINPNSNEDTAPYNTFTKPVSIGDNVWIGGNCSIVAGVSIGDNCVIGAGSVVTKDIPSNSLAAGNPCKIIREL